MSGLYRVTVLPRVPDVARAGVRGDDPEVDPFGWQRAVALTTRFHRDGDRPLRWIWQRSEPGGPLSLWTSDPATLPPGSEYADATRTGADVGGEEPTAMPSTVELMVRHDELIDGDGSESGRRPGSGSTTGARPSLASCLFAVWDRAFTAEVTAVPVRPDQLTEELERTLEAVRYAQSRMEANPDLAVRHERMLAWYRELRRGESSGLWRVKLQAGATDPDSARTVAGLLVAGYDLAGTGYTVLPRRSSDATETATEGRDPAEEANGSGSLAGTSLLAAVTRPVEHEVPGIRLALPSGFDVVAETSDGEVRLGEVLDRQQRQAGGFGVSSSSLNRHCFISGATGAGKSQTCRHLLEQAVAAGIPFLVVEPAKSEYAAMAARLPGVEVVRVRPGEPDGLACGIDPMRPADGFPLQTHLDLVKSLFLAAFDADEPFPQVLAAGLTRAYEQQGWHPGLSAPIRGDHRPRYPTLGDLQTCVLQVVDDIGYGKEVADNIRGFMRVRLGSLRLGTTGRFLEGGYRLDIGRLLASNVVLEIEDVGDDSEKSFIMGAMLIALTEHYRVAQRKSRRSPGLRHLTVFEEAHRLLRNTEGTDGGQGRGAAGRAVEMFASLLAEIRAYGEGIVVAEQIPAKLIPDVIKNTAIKIVHRLPAQDDRDAVGATMNLAPDQSDYLVTLPPGTAACFTDGMDAPVLVRMPDGSELERSGTAATVGAIRISTRGFGRCGVDYGTGRATLRQVLKATNLLDRHPVLRVWIEMTVLAHLVGLPSSPATEPVFAALAQDETVDWEVMIAVALDDALAPRSAVISRSMDLQGLVKHLVPALYMGLRGVPICFGMIDEDWIAPAFLMDGPLRALNFSNPEDPTHPNTWLWERALGVRIPGSTIAEQRQAAKLMRHRDPYAERHLLFGGERPCRLERQLGVGVANRQWPSLLAETLRPLLVNPFLFDYLCTYTPPPEGSEDEEGAGGKG